MPTLAFAHASPRLALQSSAGVVVLGPGGFEHTRALTGEVGWLAENVLTVGGALVPMELPIDAASSTLTSAVPFGFGGEDGDYLVEHELVAQWRDSGEAPPDLPPVCNDETPRRCVRTVLDEDAPDGIARLEVYDPARPARALLRVDADLPATARTVAVSSRRVRVIDSEGRMRVEPIGGGETSPLADAWSWRETRRGWVLVPSDAPDVLVGVPSGAGAIVRRTVGDALFSSGVTIVDDERALVRIGDEAHLIRIPTLETLATYPLATERVAWSCELADVVERETGTRLEGACPRPLPEDDYRTIAALLSADRAFWAEPLGDEVRVHRVADGATLTVRMTTEGTLVIGPGPTFEADGAIADHLVLREAGPARSATTTVGADVRARCERPGLVAAFFSGAPLP